MTDQHETERRAATERLMKAIEAHPTMEPMQLEEAAQLREPGTGRVLQRVSHREHGPVPECYVMAPSIDHLDAYLKGEREAGRTTVDLTDTFPRRMSPGGYQAHAEYLGRYLGESGKRMGQIANAPTRTIAATLAVAAAIEAETEAPR